MSAPHPLSDTAADRQTDKLSHEEAVRSRNERQPYNVMKDVTVDEKKGAHGTTCGAKIRRRRQEMGMTQLDLAEKTGLSEAAVPATS